MSNSSTATRPRPCIDLPEFNRRLLAAGRARLVFEGDGRVGVSFPDCEALLSVPSDAPRLSTSGTRAWLEHGGRIIFEPGHTHVHLRDGRAQRVRRDDVPSASRESVLLGLLQRAAGRLA